MSSVFVNAARQQKKARAIAQAAQIESLESRQLLSALFVSTAGSDSASGTIDAPLKTIQAALNKASSGDVITLRGGTYNLSSSLWIEQDNLTLQGYAGETAKIVASSSSSSVENVVNVGSSNNIKILNLDIAGGYYYTVKVDGGNNLLISNSKLHDSGRDVVKLAPGSDYSIIENTEIYNSGRRDASNAEGIDAVGANYAILRDSYVHDTTTNAVYYKGGSVGTIIERNRITRAAHSGILVGQSTDSNLFDDATNPTHYESIDAIVRNNIVWDIEGAGIGAWAALRPQILNNTLYNVSKSMFGGLLVQAESGRSSTDVTLYNNIVVVPGSRAVLNVRSDGLTGYLKSDNNYFYSTGGSVTILDEVNGYSGNLAGWQSRGYDKNSFAGNPGVDTGNGFHLTSSSPAINKGMTLTNVANDFDKQSRPASGAFDIGADEVGGVVNPTPTPEPEPTPEPTPEPEPTPTPVETPTWNNSSFTSQTGTFNLEWDATPTQNGMDMVMGASNGSAASVTSLAAIARFNAEGFIDARNGGAYAADASLAYQAGSKYHFKLVIDVASKKYDVYVTAPGAAATKLASGYAFRTEQAGVSALSNFATFNETGGATIANVKASPVSTVTTKGYVNTAIATQTGQFTMYLNAKAHQTNKSVIFGISSGAADSVSDMTVAIRFNSAGVIDVRTGGTWKRAATVRYAKGQTYGFRVVVDMDSRTFDVFVTNPQTGITTKITNSYTLNNGATSVNNLVKMNAHGGNITTSTPVFA